jgi:hypothetical protein
MPTADDGWPPTDLTPNDLLRHELKSPLTTILGRTQLAIRAVERTPSLAPNERVRLRLHLAVIEAAVRALVVVIDGIGRAAPNEREASAQASDPGSAEGDTSQGDTGKRDSSA